jgi:hypothetical protein
MVNRLWNGNVLGRRKLVEQGSRVVRHGEHRVMRRRQKLLGPHVGEELKKQIVKAKRVENTPL